MDKNRIRGGAEQGERAISLALPVQPFSIILSKIVTTV